MATEVDRMPLDSDGDNDHSESIDFDHVALFSNLNRCSGSAMYTFGDNIVQCSIFGPNPVALNLNLLKKNYFNVYLYPLGKIKNLTKDKVLTYYEYFFKRTFSPVVYHALLPRSRTYVVLNEIEKGSSFVTTSLNAASLALVDSGYSLNYCIGASGIILDKDGKFYTEKEYKDRFTQSIQTYEPPCFNFDSPEHTIKATFCVVNKNTSSKPVSLVAEGKFSLNDLFTVQKKSSDSVEHFFDYLKNHVKNRFV